MREACLKDEQSIHFFRLIHVFIPPVFIIKNLPCVSDIMDAMVNKRNQGRKKKKSSGVYIIVQ